MSTALVKRTPRSVGLAYLLWLPPFGMLGMHRFYTGRWLSGLLWMATFAFCGVGLAIDAAFIPRMVEDHNEGRDVW